MRSVAERVQCCLDNIAVCRERLDNARYNVERALESQDFDSARFWTDSSEAWHNHRDFWADAVESIVQD